MANMNQYVKSLCSLRLHLVTDSGKSFSLQSLLENAIGKTRQFFRVFNKEQNNLSSDRLRYQHRLPVEYFPNASLQSVKPKSKFINYRPGFIQRLTSKWVIDSLATKANRNAFRRSGGPLLCFVGFVLAKKPSLLNSDEELEGVSHAIREAFSYVPWQCNRTDIIENVTSGKKFTFDDLKLGEMIAMGCNAVVCSASLHPADSTAYDTKEERSVVAEEKDDEPPTSKLIISHSEGEQGIFNGRFKREIIKDSDYVPENFEDKDLALKVMFNYSVESNAFAIWRAMYRESLPALSEISLGEWAQHKVRKKRLKPHPNIVEMYFAFAGQFPMLPGAFKNFPQALPQRLLDSGCGRNMTLFLVMKRYHCTLREYLKMQIPQHTSLLLLTQLFEALTYLLENDVAHRDLKTDNILLDLSYGKNCPRLVITDFGCCVEGLQLSYPSDNIEKDGNIALMAPEIVNAKPGPFSILDYSRADLWTAGTLAYEIYGEQNPFYSANSSLQSYSYKWNDLPPLPTKMPVAIQKLVKDILKVDPLQRPSPGFATTVCQVLLHAPTELRKPLDSKKLSSNALDWMFKMSAETYLEYSLKDSSNYSVELELKHTFCSRIQFLDVLKALQYITSSYEII